MRRIVVLHTPITQLLEIREAGIPGIDGTGYSSLKVSHVGGTQYYLAPELCSKNKTKYGVILYSSNTRAFPNTRTRFSKKCDLFAAGVVLLELITLKSSKDVYCGEPSPKIKDSLDPALKTALKEMVDEDPRNRSSFAAVLKIIRGSGNVKHMTEVTEVTEVTE